MILTRVEEGMAAVLNHKSSARTIQGSNKVGDVFLVALHGTKVFIAQAVTKVELPSELPRILNIGVEGVDVHKAFRVTDGNCRAAREAVGIVEAIAGRYVTSQEVG